LVAIQNLVDELRPFSVFGIASGRRAQEGGRFRRMWRFYLLSCAGAFRARSLHVFSILFSKEGTAIGSGVRYQRQAASSSRTAALKPSASV
jgi:hypothetical protein